MVTTLTAYARSAHNNILAKTVRESTQQIWLAGLGAFAKTQAEGTKVFDALVEEGRSVQARTRKVAEARISGMAGTLGKMATDAGNQTTGNLHKFEQAFEKRFAWSLNRVVGPINKGIQQLAKRVEKLTANVQKLAGGASRKTVAKKTAARKPARRKAAK